MKKLKLRTALLLLSSAAILSGCASVKVTQSTTSLLPSMPPPQTYSIEVAYTTVDFIGDERVLHSVSKKLEVDLADRLRKKGYQVTYGNSLAQSDSALIRVTLRRVETGDELTRLLLGFGTGKARLSADVEVTDRKTSGVIKAFTTSSSSRFRPGLALPLGTSALLGRSLGLTILGTGANMGLGLSEGINSLIVRTDKAIVKSVIDHTRLPSSLT